MIVNFVIKGKLGNAIFRYMASVIMCMYYNGTYSIFNYQSHDVSDETFIEITKNIINQNKNDFCVNKEGFNMSQFYQHDLIYKLNKQQIVNFINNNPTHEILTDGVNAGDNNCEKYYMTDIVNTPIKFNKKYKNVLHLRLEDFVTHNLHLNNERIILLLEKNIIKEFLCIVCKKPTTDFENLYIKRIKQYAEDNNITVVLEHNDVITDYYIMKEADTLICSKSTLSWCAAFFSTSIKKCYLPDYITTPNSTCKYPIDNTELY